MPDSALRVYQKEACRSIHAKYLGGVSNTLLALPPGSGKTFTALTWGEFVSRDGTPVVWLTHRDELSRQTRDTARRVGIPCSRWDSEEKNAAGRLVVAMVLSSAGLPAALNRQRVIVIIDEAHHGAARGYHRLLEHMNLRFTLGLTATPTRLDGRDFGFDNICYQKSFLELVEQGYLARPTYVRIETGEEVRAQIDHHDFRRRDLAALNTRTRNETIIREILAHPEYGKQIVFCVDRNHAEALRTLLAEHVGDRAKALDSSYSDRERKEGISWFRDSPDGVLCSCELYIEGLDVPDIKTVHLARPTASKTYYMQMLGRGARVLPGKDSFFIVDYMDQIDKYAHLSEEWTMEELGAPARPAGQHYQQQLLRALEEMAQEEEMPVPQIIRRKVLEVDGILTTSSPWHPNQKTIITKEQRRMMEQLYLRVMVDNPEGGVIRYRVDDYYQEIVGDSRVLSRRRWNRIFWSMWKRFCCRQELTVGAPTFNYRKLVSST